MASIERTAYPRFSDAVTAAELQHSFTPTEAEAGLAQNYTRTDQHVLCFVILLKSFQRLHYLPALEQVPASIITHVRTCLRLGPEVVPAYETGRTLYRHHMAIREYLRVKPFEGKQARHLAVEAAYRAAQVMNPQADLINAAIEALIQSRYELPSFWALNPSSRRS